MLDWLFPSKEIRITLAVPLSTVLERLNTTCRPIPWSDRLFLAYTVCHIASDELVLRRSNTLRSIGQVEFRAHLDLSSRDLRGTLQFTMLNKAFFVLWMLLWSTLLIWTVTMPPRPHPATVSLPLWASILFFGFALGGMPFLFRAGLSERHPHRKQIMDVLQRAASTPAA